PSRPHLRPRRRLPLGRRQPRARTPSRDRARGAHPRGGAGGPRGCRQSHDLSTETLRPGDTRGRGLGSYWPVKFASRAATPILVALALTACGATGPTARPAASTAKASPRPITLAQAISRATSLGPAGAGTEVVLNFSLKSRHAASLAALVASGHTVTPDEYSSEFGPDPLLVSRALAFLRSFGLQAAWSRGSSLIQAQGPAPAVDALLEIGIVNYRLGNGQVFYASLDNPVLASPPTAVVSAVAGLDSYRQMRRAAVSPGGPKPVDVRTFDNPQP